MKLSMTNIMLDAAAKFVPSCCGAVICSFTDEATEEQIETQALKMHGRVVIIVGGKSYPKSVTKIYDGVGLIQVGMCKCASSKCPLGSIPSRNIDETVVFDSRRISKIADNVFILQTLNGIKEDEIKKVVAKMETGDVMIAIATPYHEPEANAFLACGWKSNELDHHTYGNARTLNMLSFKK